MKIARINEFGTYLYSMNKVDCFFQLYEIYYKVSFIVIVRLLMLLCKRSIMNILKFKGAR